MEKLQRKFRMQKLLLPKRSIELIALIAISTTLFLFIHTRELTTKLKEMEVKLQPEDLISNQISGDSGPSHITGGRTMLKILQSTGEVIAVSISGPNNTIYSVVMVSSLLPSQINNTANAQQEMIFFNRVPKVGSQMFMELLKRLSFRNDFYFHQDKVRKVETIKMSWDSQERMAAMVSLLAPPGVFVKHVCFTNFSDFGFPEPIYINVVRDPIERVISWYYYVRAPWYYVERKINFPDLPLPDPMWLRKDFETCVLSNDPECKYVKGETLDGIGDHRRQSMFFCGHDDDCLPFNTRGVLEMAKMTVDKHYAVVGVLEELNKTLTVFENYVPRFFQGASQIYWDEMSSFTLNKNIYKPPVSEKVKEIVRRNFTQEIEFYEFCKQRLHKQYSALRLTEGP